MNKKKVPTYNEGRLWRGNNIKDILKRPTYAGYQYKSNSKELVELKTLKGKKKYKPVSKSEFLRVKDILATHTPTSRATPGCHPLSGLLYCGECGRLMTISTSTNIRTKNYKFIYRCRSKKEQYLQGQKYDCDTNITAYRDAPLPLFDFKTFKPNGLLECIHPLLAFEHTKRLNENNDATYDEVILLKNQIKLIDDTKQTLMTNVTSGLMSQEDFNNDLKPYLEKKKKLNNQLISLENSLLISGDENDPLSDMRIKTQLSQGILARETAKQLIHRVIEKINVHKTHLEVKLKGIDELINIPRMVYFRAHTLPYGKIKIDEDKQLVTVKYYLKTYYTKQEKTEKKVWSNGGMTIYFIGNPS